MDSISPRRFWLQRIEKAWQRRPLIWLTGVRRVGKTTLSRSIESCDYFDCELPKTRLLMQDPESFLESLGKKRVILDEIHRLNNPAELLKIASDHFPHLKVLATGSSTLQASSKFRDTLTGRKTEIWLTPIICEELDFFEATLSQRLKRGGLPPALLATSWQESDYQEWMDSYWAKDIQELFRLERRWSFQKFLELIFVNSGGIFEANHYATPCEISRTTVANYLNVMEMTKSAFVIRPYSKRAATEIVSAPKVYAFDTGFICYHRGWTDLRPEDLGILWEHIVLNEIQAKNPNLETCYWRTKQSDEIDFVLLDKGKPPITVECKWQAAKFDPTAVSKFRKIHSGKTNWVVAQDVKQSYKMKKNGLHFEVMNITDFSQKLEKSMP